ncbi:MAG: geranylgeranyl reductase family protein [Limisphaerales bacterium]|jgi:geranylgeranyl reductase family protein
MSQLDPSFDTDFDTDILIAGAGPGGCTTAIQLAKSGRTCIIIDKATFPRDKICGDALSGKVVDTLRKIDPEMVERLSLDPANLGCWGVDFVAPSGQHLEVPFKLDYLARSKTESAPGFISRRMDFDHYMLKEALAYPQIDYREKTSLNEIRRIPGGFEIETNNGKLRARIIIGAEGAHSVVAKKLAGMTMDPAHHCAAVRAYYTGVEGLHEHHFIELHYLKDVIPGYFWIFPLAEGRANVGLGLRTDIISKKKINLKKLMEDVIANHPIISPRFKAAKPEGKIQGFGLPLGSKRRTMSGDGYMLIGDAASLIDPFTGEGIGNAMISGRLAALQAIEALKAKDLSAAKLRPYDDAVWRQLGDELMLSRKLQQLASYPRLFNFVVKKANGNPALRETISCMFEDMDMREKLRKPSFYFRVLFG